MFKAMIVTAFVYIAIQGKEDDGTNNYMLQTVAGPSIGYKISYSSKTKLPFNRNEPFLARMDLECEYDYFAKDWPDGFLETGRLYICNVQKLEY